MIQNTPEEQERYDSFIDGFSTETGLSKSDAQEQWGAFSRELDDNERQETEQKGFDSGVSEGAKFSKLYPDCTNHGE